MWALAGGGQVGGEHGVEQAGVLYAGGADDLAKLEAAEAGGDDVLRANWRKAIRSMPWRVWNSVATTPGQQTWKRRPLGARARCQKSRL